MLQSQTFRASGPYLSSSIQSMRDPVLLVVQSAICYGACVRQSILLATLIGLAGCDATGGQQGRRIRGRWGARADLPG